MGKLWKITFFIGKTMENYEKSQVFLLRKGWKITIFNGTTIERFAMASIANWEASLPGKLGNPGNKFGFPSWKISP